MIWRGCVVHHSAGVDRDSMQADDIHRFHTLERGWRHLGYHKLVEQIEGHYVAIDGRPMRWEGAHAPPLNHSHLGLCFVGNFTETPPPNSALWMGAEVLADWAVMFGWEGDLEGRIIPHRDVKATACPGDAFPFERLVQMVGERL